MHRYSHIKISFQYKYPHVKDKTVSWPPYLKHGNPHTWKDGPYTEMGTMYQRQGQVIASHGYRGIYLLVLEFYTYHWHTAPHISTPPHNIIHLLLILLLQIHRVYCLLILKKRVARKQYMTIFPNDQLAIISLIRKWMSPFRATYRVCYMRSRSI